MVAKSKAQRVLEKYETFKMEKAPWLPMYQLLGEYIHTRKQNFTTDISPGAFLTDQLFDNTAASSNYIMASSMIGAMWPNGAKSFRIGIPMALKNTDYETDEVKGWYQSATKMSVATMDNPKAGLLLSLEEYMIDQGAFGISGIGAFENEGIEIPVRYISVDAKRMAIDENNHGFVDTVFIEKEMSIRNAVQEYGLENLSKGLRDKYEKGETNEKLKVLHAIEPRMERDPYGFGAADMPIASIHIEIESKKILRESGYQEMPVFVTRFWKVMGEKQGRCPGMAALPDILEMNAIREAYELAHEKNLDPPMAVYDDGTLGGGTIDTSAGAVNVFSVNGKLGSTQQKPVEQLITVGELNSTAQRIVELREIIKNHFFLDRLMDLNNEQRMTLGEANIRNQLRAMSLGMIYTRQIAELFMPLVERTFNILLAKGLLGVVRGSEEEEAIVAEGGSPVYIPDAVAALMAQGKDVYDVEFISPAARIMKAEELAGIQQTLQIAIDLGQGIPEAGLQALDNIDLDVLMRRVQDLTGAPSEIVVAVDTVKKIRSARIEAMQKQQEMQMAQQGSEVARNAAQASQMSKAA